MKYNPILKMLFIFSTLFLLGACHTKQLPPSKGGYKYHNIYFGSHLTMHYKEGIQDGCNTAKGIYTKDHWLFNNSNDYNHGWFLGRNKCRKLLKIDKNGDLIL